MMNILNNHNNKLISPKSMPPSKLITGGWF